MVFLLRRVRRPATWEQGDVEDVIRLEFRDPDGNLDLQPSIYLLEADSSTELRSLVVRVQAEHSATFIDPAAAWQVDWVLLADGYVEPQGGRTHFSHANEAHRIVRLPSEAVLRDLIERTVHGLAERLTDISKQELLDYVAGQLDARDPEWVAAEAAGGHPTAWAKKARARLGSA